MAKKEDKKQALEELSPEELREQIEEDKKQAKRSTMLAISALIAIIALCIAWFVANNLVKGVSSQISAKSDIAYKLASVGNNRQDTIDGTDKLTLHEGEKVSYEKYYDTETSTEVEHKQTYHVGTVGLAWYMNGQETMSPGARGKLEFYVIPQHDGGSSVDVKLELKAYKENEEKKVEEVTVADGKKSVQDLVKGHILLFQNLNDQDGYSGWCYDSGKKENIIHVQAPKDGFEKNVPCKVTVYWVWPKYFRNYIYNSRYVDGDLFEENTTDDAQNVLKFVQSKDGQKLLFAMKDGTEAEYLSGIGTDMADNIYNECNQYYNQADEWFGGQTDYIYVNATLN